jgi:hypothetical protein
MQKDDDL